MAYEDRHDVVFQELFKNNPEGHALYLPFSSTALKPGACGYFDYDGDWHTIAYLTDSAALEADGWTQAPGVEVEPVQTEEYWGAMVSKGVDQFYPSVDVNVAVPGVPAGGGIKVGYKVHDDAGGLMVTDSQVTHNQLTPSACRNARIWFIENAESILLQNELTKKKGIWVVTKTYTAKRRAVALLQTHESSVVFGVNAELYGVGKIAPEASWWRSSKEQVWKVAQP
ncbi:hypothetical protein N7522_006244 [Penicillium canescens]|nr:hypothetical protein N7522_006244 [Penicillium canescens]